MRGVIKAGPGPGLAFRDDLSVPGKMILYPGPVKNRRIEESVRTG